LLIIFDCYKVFLVDSKQQQQQQQQQGEIGDWRARAMEVDGELW
jgi:hypothetical protein